MGGHVEVVSLLVKNKAQVNVQAAQDRTPLDEAIRKGHPEVVSILLKHGAEVNVGLPLHSASSRVI